MADENRERVVTYMTKEERAESEAFALSRGMKLGPFLRWAAMQAVRRGLAE